MKIVILDGYTLNPGDISWEGLQQFGEVIIHDRTDFLIDTIVKTIGNAEIIFTNKTPLSKEVLQQVPNVKYIGVLATGYNVVDVQSANELGITVTNIPSYGTHAVAQFTFGLLLELCHHIGKHNHAVKSGEWEQSPDFCFWKTPLVELSKKTIGIIGFGSIGQATAKIAIAFGMKVIVYTRTLKEEFDGIEFVSLEDALTNSDIVSLHCPLTKETEGIINKNSLNKMKPNAFLINTSRGPLINEADLKEALDNKVIAGAAVDVVSEEPIKGNNPLLRTTNCIVTPHIAWASIESRQRLMDTAIDNLQAYLSGNPKNKV